MESMALIPIEFIEKYKSLNPELIEKIIGDWQKEYCSRCEEKSIQEKTVEILQTWFDK